MTHTKKFVIAGIAAVAIIITGCTNSYLPTKGGDEISDQAWEAEMYAARKGGTFDIVIPNDGQGFSTNVQIQTLSGICPANLSNLKTSLGTFSDSNCSDGTWSLAPYALVEGQNSFNISGTLHRGKRTSAVSTAMVIAYDPIPPALAITNPTDQDHLSTSEVAAIISGTCSTDAINLKTSLGSFADSDCSDGLWMLQSHVLALGLNVFMINAEDRAGNVISDEVQIERVVGPQPPQVAITSPSSTSPYFTNIMVHTIAGACSSDVVQLTSSLGSVVDADCSDGLWSLAPFTLTGGSNVFTIIATNSNGLSASTRLEIQYTPPLPVQLAITAPTSDSSYQTSDQLQTLSGTCSTNAVNLTTNRGSFADSNCSDGHWSLQTANLTEGLNTFVIRAENGYDSVASDQLDITYIRPPQIAFTSPSSGSTFTTANPLVVVSGTCSVDAVGLTINHGVFADSDCSDGQWSLSAFSLLEGSNLFILSGRNSLGASASAQLEIIYQKSPPPLSGGAVWDTDGYVYSMITDPITQRLYLGGSFNRVRPYTGGIVFTDPATGRKMPGSIGPFSVDGTIRVVISDGKGGFYVGGDFSKIGSVTRPLLAHVLSNGAVDLAFDAGMPTDTRMYKVGVLALFGSSLYVGGSFFEVNGLVRRMHLAELDAATGKVRPWNPDLHASVGGGGPPNLRAMILTNSTIIVGGRFSSIGGNPCTHTDPLPRNNFVEIDRVTGEATPLDLSPNGYIWAMALSGSSLYIGGEFTQIGGQARAGAAKIDLNTHQVMAWDPLLTKVNVDGDTDINRVQSVLPVGSSVYIGGTFTHASGQARNKLAEIDAITARPTAWAPHIVQYMKGTIHSTKAYQSESTVKTMYLKGTSLLIGGTFNQVGDVVRTNAAEVDRSTGAALGWQPNPGSDVNLINPLGSAIVIAGTFSTVGSEGVARTNFAEIDLKTGRVTALDIPIGPPNSSYVFSLAIQGSDLYAGGVFTEAGGLPRKNLAKINLATGQIANFRADADSTVEVVAASPSGLYVGGAFRTINNQPRIHLAKLNASSGEVFPWMPNPDLGWVQDIVFSGGSVYVAGWFNNISSQPRTGVAKFDDSSGQLLPWNAHVDEGFVHKLLIDGSYLYLAGSFKAVGGKSRGRIARVDANSGAVAAWNPFLCEGSVESMAINGSTLIFGESSLYHFGTTCSTSSAGYLWGKIDTETGTVTPFDKKVLGTPRAFAFINGKTYVAGPFNFLGYYYCDYPQPFQRSGFGQIDLATGDSIRPE